MIFYRECIIGHIQHSEEAVVKCPYQDDYACDMDIAEYEIKAVYFLYITEKPLIKNTPLCFSHEKKTEGNCLLVHLLFSAGVLSK